MALSNEQLEKLARMAAETDGFYWSGITEAEKAEYLNLAHAATNPASVYRRVCEA